MTDAKQPQAPSDRAEYLLTLPEAVEQPVSEGGVIDPAQLWAAWTIELEAVAERIKQEFPTVEVVELMEGLRSIHLRLPTDGHQALAQAMSSSLGCDIVHDDVEYEELKKVPQSVQYLVSFKGPDLSDMSMEERRKNYGEVLRRCKAHMDTVLDRVRQEFPTVVVKNVHETLGSFSAELPEEGHEALAKELRDKLGCETAAHFDQARFVLD